MVVGEAEFFGGALGDDGDEALADFGGAGADFGGAVGVEFDESGRFVGCAAAEAGVFVGAGYTPRIDFVRRGRGRDEGMGG